MGSTCFNMISVFQGHTLFSWINLYVGKNYHSRHKRFLPMGRNEAVDQWGENKNLCYFDVNSWWYSFFETLMIIFQYAIHLTPESTGNSARLLFHHHLSLFLKKHLYSRSSSLVFLGVCAGKQELFVIPILQIKWETKGKWLVMNILVSY